MKNNDYYYKRECLLEAGHDEFWVATLDEKALSDAWFEEFGVPRMIEAVKTKGEKDGNITRIWLDDLNGVCNLDGYTDVMCAHLGEDGKLTFQVNSPDDKSTIFEYIYAFPVEVADLIAKQVFDYKKNINYVYTQRRGESTEVICTSHNIGVLRAKMKGDIQEFIEEVYGDDLDEALSWLKPAEETTDFWSDEDDEYETVFQIHKVEEI